MVPDDLMLFFEKLRKQMPESLKRLARNRFVRSISKPFDPRLHSGFIWKVEGGVIGGLRMDIGGPGNYHMVANPYEPQMQAALSRLVEPGMVCADVGAHIGYMSLVLAKLTGPAGDVFAFEPDPENASLVERNRALNPGIAPISVIEAAVGDGSSESVKLFFGSTTSEHSLFRKRGNGSTSRTVLAVALDRFFAQRRIPEVLKIDVEGAEEQVLRGMRRILENVRPAIVMEVHGLDGWPALEILKAYGYVIRDLEGMSFNESSPRNEICHVVATAQ